MSAERDEFRDEVIERVAVALRPLSSSGAPVAVARIMAQVRARRRPSRLALVLAGTRERSVSVATAGLMMAAALVLGFVGRGAIPASEAPADELATSAAGVRSAEATIRPANGGAREQQLVPVPLRFEGGNARSVAIVGDFNGWDSAASPMQRSGAGGPWTATILAKPGRHVYAFLVDGTTLVADPRAPHAQDLDYGGDASVLMVNVP